MGLITIVVVIIVIPVITGFAWKYYKKKNDDILQHAHDRGEIMFDGHKTNVPIDPDRYYSEEEAADIAIEAKGLTILRSDSGRLWKSSMNGRTHAEDRFLDDGTEDVKTIWLKNSPCLKCAQRLNRERRPMHIYVGHIYREHNRENEMQRIREIEIMKQNGFTFSAWNVYCRKAGIDEIQTNHNIIYSM